MIAVTGAAIVLSTLRGARAGRRRSLAWDVVRNTKRAGVVLALVGPKAASSYRRRSTSEGTGRESQTLWVRASRKIWSIQSLETALLRGAETAAGASDMSGLS